MGALLVEGCTVRPGARARPGERPWQRGLGNGVLAEAAPSAASGRR